MARNLKLIVTTPTLQCDGTNLEYLSMYERDFMGNAKSLSGFTEMLEQGRRLA